MQVLLFASLAEIVGVRSIELDELDVPGTVGELVEQLTSSHPQLAGRSFRIAIDQRYATLEQTLSGDEEVALIPPVSGG